MNELNSLFGMPMIRDGDNVYFIQQPDYLSRASMMEMAERMALRFDDYECPFDFMTEHAKWFEWKRREYFEKNATGNIMVDMVSDVERIKAHKVEKPLDFRVYSRFDIGLPLSTPSVLLNTTF